jgi:hypothetical protein
MTDEATTHNGTPPLEPNRALVFVERRRKARVLPRAAADFLAQLIASDRHLGEFRRARRRDPSTGIGEYQAPELPCAPEFERSV